MLKRIVCLICVLMLTGCSSKSVAPPSIDVRLGFLILDGNGIASKPFSDVADYAVEWQTKPTWTALPIWVSGNLDGKVLRNATASSYSYKVGTSDAADAYYHVITEGYQEGFEDLWTEVYNKLNNIQDVTPIDSTILSDILKDIHGDTKYGTLQDTVTDALVLVKNVNDNGPSKEYNAEAEKLYNQFYAWLHNFSTDSL